MSLKNEPPDPIMQFFGTSEDGFFDEKARLEQNEIRRPFASLAKLIVDVLPRNPERTVALRKLLEAQDAALRSMGFR